MIRKLIAMLVAVIFLSSVAMAGAAPAQQRMSDKDLERMMTNLRNDSKRFGDVFNPAIHKSTIRKTQQEKDGKALVKTFQNQTDAMLDQFKKTKQGQPALTGVQDSANRIDKLLTDVPMGPQVSEAWAKVKTELSTISDQFK
jgi:hypothetical protein